MPAVEVDPTDGLAWAAGVLASRITRARELTGGSTGLLLAVSFVDRPAAVLRLITEEPWRTHGPALITREHEIQRMLARTAIPVPESFAIDPSGARCGHPAHLMSLVPGTVQIDRRDDASLGEMADLLAEIHAVVPTIEVRAYQSWAWESKFVVPAWATAPAAWERAFEILRTDPPDFEPSFIHRDFASRNILWSDARISGTVDWVETSIGPAWLDVAHCCTNLALDHDNDVADAFADAYVARTGRAPDAYWDVMDVVGFLPAPGRPSLFDMPAEAVPRRLRLEERLLAILPRIARGR